MDQNVVSGLSRTTLRAGIIVGAIGAFSVVLAPQVMQSLQLGPAYSLARAGAAFSAGRQPN